MTVNSGAALTHPHAARATPVGRDGGRGRRRRREEGRRWRGRVGKKRVREGGRERERRGWGKKKRRGVGSWDRVRYRV